MDAGRTRSTVGKLSIGLALALGAGLLLAACGGDDDEGAAAAGDDATLVEEAQALVAEARGGLVYSTVDTPTEPSELEPYGDWRGPTSSPNPPEDVNVQVIACASTATGCQSGAEGAIEAAEELGWEADLIDGGGEPQGWGRAFNTALRRNPDAIVSIGIPTIAVGDSIAEARRQGVLVIGAADSPPPEGEAYDGYTPYPFGAIWAMGAWSAIAESDGQANQLVPQETDYPIIVEGVANYEAVIEQCSGCSAETVDWQVADSIDPARVNRIVGGALSRNPDANGIFVSLGHVVPALSETLASEGLQGELDVGVSVADPTAIELVAAGAADYTVGTPPPWAGWASIDQTIRGLADEPYLELTELGFGIGELTTETAPASGDFDEWEGAIDYRAEYRSIWGLD